MVWKQSAESPLWLVFEGHVELVKGREAGRQQTAARSGFPGATDLRQTARP
jgi:hypothetical protein